MAELRVSGVIERGGFRLQVPPLCLPGEGVTALFGPSGTGKSSFLDALAGLMPAAAFNVRHGERDWRSMPPRSRGIGMVRQQEPLFSHMTVAENLRFPLRFTTGGAFSFDQVVGSLRLGGWLSRYPHQLSGGQRQRVALGRALLRQPDWLFLDEPLSALDDAARDEVMTVLERVKRDFAVPMLLVTHRVDEVERLADRVMFFSAQGVTPPQTLRAAVGRVDSPLFDEAEPVSLLEGEVIEPCNGDGLSEISVGGQRLLSHPVALPKGARCRVRVPAAQVMLALEPVEAVSALNRLSLVVEDVWERGYQVVARLRFEDGQLLLATVTRRTAARFGLRDGQRIWALIKAVSIL